MGRIDKGINCSIQGCGESAERSITGSKARMAPDLDIDASGKGYIFVKCITKNGRKLRRRIVKMRGLVGDD